MSTILMPEDVPGAVLQQNVEDCSVLELQRWLECRGLKKRGAKSELVQRVANCISAGREDIIFLGVDGGKWYDMKRNILQNTSSSRVPPQMPGNCLKWGRFPSQSIPKYFNKGHIYTYIAGLEIENEEYEVPDADGITTEKPFRRGSQYVGSDYLHEVFDAKNNKYYYLKAKCYSSFRQKLVYVSVILNQMSGAVVSGQCECKQSALGRCSHVSATLLFLSKFTEENGHDNAASTSKLRQWGLGAKVKNPGAVASKYYPTVRFQPLERAVFDPRPSNYERSFNVNDFICDLQREKHSTMFETVLKLTYEDFKMSELDEQVLREQVEIFRNNMAKYMSSYKTKVFAVKGAEVQGSEGWKYWRTYFITASNTKTASSLTTVSAKSIFLKKNLWQLTPLYSMVLSLQYGRKNEPVARKKYAANYLDVTETLVEVGLYVNKDFPHLACSVDGLVIKDGNVERIIEIKCPKVLENSDPCDFARVLSEKQKGSFCLEHQNGEVKLKDNHPYLYQVVTSMLIFEVSECDFIVWSNANMLVFKIKLQNVQTYIIENIRVKLMNAYYNMYVPEMFLMKIPRNLPLNELNN